MRNFVQPGENLTVVFPYAVAAGDGALIGPGLFGIAATDTAQGAIGALVTAGVFMVAKAAGAIAAGDKLYWDDAARNLTKVANGNPYVAAAVRAPSAADAGVVARLNGVTI